MADAIFSPLVWPQGVERSTVPIVSRGHPSVKKAIARVIESIDLLGEVTASPATEIVISCEGIAHRWRDVDPGAAVWFVWSEVQRCVACDLYTSPGGNLSTIAELVRSCVAEHGRGSVAAVAHALAGHTPRSAVLAETIVQGHWSKTLGVRRNASSSEITAAFRRRALQVHPDKGGTRQQWDEVMASFQKARLEIASVQFRDTTLEVATPAADEEIWANLFPNPSTTMEPN